MTDFNAPLVGGWASVQTIRPDITPKAMEEVFEALKLDLLDGVKRGKLRVFWPSVVCQRVFEAGRAYGEHYLMIRATVEYL